MFLRFVGLLPSRHTLATQKMSFHITILCVLGIFLCPVLLDVDISICTQLILLGINFGLMVRKFFKDYWASSAGWRTIVTMSPTLTMTIFSISSTIFAIINLDGFMKRLFIFISISF